MNTVWKWKDDYFTYPGPGWGSTPAMIRSMRITAKGIPILKPPMQSGGCDPPVKIGTARLCVGSSQGSVECSSYTVCFISSHSGLSTKSSKTVIPLSICLMWYGSLLKNKSVWYASKPSLRRLLLRRYVPIRHRYVHKSTPISADSIVWKLYSTFHDDIQMC